MLCLIHVVKFVLKVENCYLKFMQELYFFHRWFINVDFRKCSKCRISHVDNYSRPGSNSALGQ